MESVVDEIKKAIAALSLSPHAVRLLPPIESEAIFSEAFRHFVSGGDRLWWWEAFRKPGVSRLFESGDGWRHLPQIIPSPDEPVWFIAEDGQLPQFPVFEVSPRIASQIIGECYGFEYYLVAKDYGWLVCENHHNAVFAVGEAVEGKLAVATV